MGSGGGYVRVAGIDCGTNSARLLIGDVVEGRLVDRCRKMTITRLGQGVDETGRLAPEAIERTLAALADYAAAIEKDGVDRIRVVATSASRDAANASVFVEGVTRLLGVAPEVVCGEEEASLSFRGAMSGLDEGVDRPIVLVDIGGGSTEFVFGNRDLISACSTNMGSVRVYERFFASVVDETGSLEPRSAQLKRAMIDAVAFIDDNIREAGEAVDFSRARSLVGVAGTVTTVTALALGLSHYDPRAIDNSRLTPAQVNKACNQLQVESLDQRRAHGFMPAGREDVIGAGALVWQRIVEKMARSMQERGRELETIVTAEHDILDGIALSAATN